MSRRTHLSRMTTALTALALPAVLLGAIQPTSDQQITQASNAASAKKPTSGPIFGISDPTLIDESQTVQEREISAIKSIGIRSVRIEANWAWVQPADTEVFDWSILDREVQSIRRTGLAIDLVIDGCPRWAAVSGTVGDPSPQPKSATQYASWATDVAARYASEGVQNFEIWNEENTAEFWQPKPNPAAYAKDLVAAYKGIKRIDKSAFVISGGLAPAATDSTDYNAVDFLKKMYQDGAKGSFDALGYHPYVFPALPNTYEPWSAWSQMSKTVPSIRSIMSGNGDSAKKVWITEFGAPSSGPSSIGTSGQAAQLAQALADAKKTGWIGSLYVYTWRDSPSVPAQDNGFGLLTESGQPKAAYHAVAAAIKPGEGCLCPARDPARERCLCRA